ncbi:MAG: hypothetical protein WBO08_10405 [Mycobacterium sp.]|nr:hypothetical protein [Mycobacterium sp.]
MPEDGAFADQVADGQRGTHEHRGDVGQDKQLGGLVGSAAGDGGRSEADVARHHQRQGSEDERQQNQKQGAAAVGEDQR